MGGIHKFIIRGAFVCTLAILCTLGVSARYVRGGGSASCIVEVAQGEIGVTETSPNWSPRIKEYLASVDFYSPAYWCAAFVRWVLDECGVESRITAWSPTSVAQNVIYTRGSRWNRTPEAGDVGALYYPSIRRVGHTFIIESWGNKVLTIEGNSNDDGSRNGNKVCRRVRLQKTIYKVSRYR